MADLNIHIISDSTYLPAISRFFLLPSFSGEPGAWGTALDGSGTAVSQSFVLAGPTQLKMIAPVMNRQSSTAGTVVVKVYTHSGSWGTTGVPGTLVATSDVRNTGNQTGAPGKYGYLPPTRRAG